MHKVNGQTIAYTFPLLDKFSKSIMVLNEIIGKAQQVEDERFEFKDARTVLVKNKLYTFQFGSPVSACKYTDFTSPFNLVKTALSTLPRNEYLQDFSLCHVAGRIVLTGGVDEEYDPSA